MESFGAFGMPTVRGSAACLDGDGRTLGYYYVLDCPALELQLGCEVPSIIQGNGPRDLLPIAGISFLKSLEYCHGCSYKYSGVLSSIADRCILISMCYRHLDLCFNLKVLLMYRRPHASL